MPSAGARCLCLRHRSRASDYPRHPIVVLELLHRDHRLDTPHPFEGPDTLATEFLHFSHRSEEPGSQEVIATQQHHDTVDFGHCRELSGQFRNLPRIGVYTKEHQGWRAHDAEIRQGRKVDQMRALQSPDARADGRFRHPKITRNLSIGDACIAAQGFDHLAIEGIKLDVCQRRTTLNSYFKTSVASPD